MCAWSELYAAGMKWEEVVKELHVIFSAEDVDVDRTKALLNAYQSNPHDWRQYAIFDQHRYTRNLVDKGNVKFNLLVLCWPEGVGSPIHDHTDAHCFVKVLEGQLKETQFLWPKEGAEEAPMEEKQVAVYEADAVSYMSDSIGLHRMENPSHTEGAVSLHVYIPPFQECRKFDEWTGHAETVKMTFWSKDGVKIPLPAPSNLPH